MSDTAEMIAFVRARLDEADQWAADPDAAAAIGASIRTAANPARPDRVLALTTAQRNILDTYEVAGAAVDAPENLASSHWEGDSGYVNGLWFAVEQIAAAYSGHPDYQARWGSAFIEPPR